MIIASSIQNKTPKGCYFLIGSRDKNAPTELIGLLFIMLQTACPYGTVFCFKGLNQALFAFFIDFPQPGIWYFQCLGFDWGKASLTTPNLQFLNPNSQRLTPDFNSWSVQNSIRAKDFFVKFCLFFHKNHIPKSPFPLNFEGLVL